MKRIFFLSLIIAGCAAPKQATVSETQPAGIPVTPPVVAGKLFTSVYQQTAGEYKALCYQAFALAKLRLETALQRKGSRPLAIITDIDETILDNSKYAIHMGLQGKDYDPLTWSQWIARSEADTMPGALSFLKFAEQNGVEIFYITNRDEKDRNGTQKNLEIYNFPNADARHLIMRDGPSSKELRRREVMGAFDVVLLMGDNLADFASDFDKKNIEDREVIVNKLSAEFGNRFIVLPNPVYGDWEAVLYQYNNGYNLAQRDSILRAAGKGY